MEENNEVKTIEKPESTEKQAKQAKGGQSAPKNKNYAAKGNKAHPKKKANPNKPQSDARPKQEKTQGNKLKPKANAKAKPHENKPKQNKNEVVNTFKYVVFVHFKDSRPYSFGSDIDAYEVGDKVIVETVRGYELGFVCKPTVLYEDYANKSLQLKPVLSIASQRDYQRYLDNIESAKDAFMLCQKEIKRLQLDMNLIEAEYTLDRSKILFTYVADERVDFRELLKAMAPKFKCRIELKQIGPRNKAKMIGGFGQCGRELCCCKFMNDFEMVSINMAKNQLLALNIQKLSGQCGKLKCCLRFEDEQYKVMREGLPKLNSKLMFEGKQYRLTNMNVITKEAKIENKEEVRFLSFEELWPEMDFSDR